MTFAILCLAQATFLVAILAMPLFRSATPRPCVFLVPAIPSLTRPVPYRKANLLDQDVSFVDVVTCALSLCLFCFVTLMLVRLRCKTIVQLGSYYSSCILISFLYLVCR